MRTAATLALLFVGASLSLAQNPVGTWKGKFNFKYPPMPANATPQQKAQFTEMKSRMDKAVIFLTIKGDKTFTIKAEGMPMASAGTEKGTWTQAGKAVTLKTSPNPKNPNFNPPPQVANFSKDGKTLTIVFPGGSGNIVFKK